MGAAGLAAIDGSDPRRSRTGYAALEAGATGVALATGLKYGFGRARPGTGMGPTDFQWGARSDSFHSFPSIHTVTAWSVVTPFALEYDMPWLYGVAALTNLSRIGGRNHWVSDTVASSLIGYGLGRMFWNSSREQAKGEPYFFFDGSGLSMLWDW
jgi:membrane-associated phospholipid phosphatase